KIPGCINWLEIEGPPQYVESLLQYLTEKLKFGAKDISLKTTQELFHIYKCKRCKEGLNIGQEC
ncbi:MAG: hypothetical protein JSW13_01705, partial [Candidatus Aerophobus sp.]